jgi:hypothetical protein
LLALVDEVATDSVTRGALKDDAAFKSLRDVIKKCNKILERMLVRRESKYTLFYRLIGPNDKKDCEKINVWNVKMEQAVQNLSNGGEENDNDDKSVGSEAASVNSESSSSSGFFRRGRDMSAGRVRTRRATPTPRMRNRFRRDKSVSSDTSSTSGDDGYATVTASNVAKLQKSLEADDQPPSLAIPRQFKTKSTAPQNPITTSRPRDELKGIVRELSSQQKDFDSGKFSQKPEDLKPNWIPKADIPAAVPKLPVEYIHRHRLMKQVVNSLINRPGADENETSNCMHNITCITSRHADKAGNGKTTLAAAAIQSVEVRQRFKDGIAWVQLGRAPLLEQDFRRIYEEIYDQLFSHAFNLKSEGGDGNDFINALLHSRRKFQGYDFDGMREELQTMLKNKKVLICLDDVWRKEDASKFIFDSAATEQEPDHRLLITTRTPNLMGGEANEVFVRIFSEQEAVKLLLSAGGRRLYGGKNSPVFNDARIIVKGCGNSPLALRLAGGMLRTSNRNWTLTSSSWCALIEQCKLCLEEASSIRSFVHSVGRIVDLSFMIIEDMGLRASLRRCFVTFAMVFQDNELLLSGKGIPRGIVRRLFINVISGTETEENATIVSPDIIIDMLEHMNLLQRAGHEVHMASGKENLESAGARVAVKSKSLANGCLDDAPEDEQIADLLTGPVPHKLCYLMHESVSKSNVYTSQILVDSFLTFYRILRSSMLQQTCLKDLLRHLLQSLIDLHLFRKNYQVKGSGLVTFRVVRGLIMLLSYCLEQ